MTPEVVAPGGRLAEVICIAKRLHFERVDVAEAFPPLAKALARLESDDALLLRVGAHERAICHRLAVYLERELDPPAADGEPWHVDCEYNLHSSKDPRALSSAEMKKVLAFQGRSDNEAEEAEHSVFPDLVVHRRGSDDNELIVEMKIVRGSPDRAELELDLRKLAAFQESGKGFEYRSALFLAVCSPSFSPQQSSHWEVGVFAPRGKVA